MTRIWHAIFLVVAFAGPATGASMSDGRQQDRVTAVTLYRNQALVTRQVETNAAAGAQVITVTNLPEHVVPDSLAAVGDQSIEIRAVQFRSRVVVDSPNEKVRELEKAIQQTSDQINLTQKNIELTNKQEKYLDRMENFVAPTATTELSQGVLDAEALRQLTEFSFQQREQIVNRQFELQKEERQLQNELNFLRQQLVEISNGTNHFVREAVIFVHKTDASQQSIQLNYLVNQCGWNPTYTVFSSENQDTAKLEYHGLIHQMSGEDWNDIRITLSTAFPSISAAGPGLAPLRLSLSNPSLQQTDGLMQQLTQTKMEQMLAQQQIAINDNITATNFAELNESNWNLNTAANQLACAFLNGDTTSVNRWNRDVNKTQDEPSLNYELQGTVTLPSRLENQMVRIASTQLPSKAYHVATPVLTNYIYREAELNNTSEFDFLSGPILVYFDNRFVGRGEIPTVTRGQQFVVGFGADPQLRARRELVAKTDNIHGGNHELSFEYRLFIENYKGQEALVRVIDRIPSADNGNDVRIRTNDFTDALSTDDTYLRSEKPEGILRWDLNVPSMQDDNAYEIRYTYTVEYDRSYVVSLPTSQQKDRQDFERMQRRRALK